MAGETKAPISSTMYALAMSSADNDLNKIGGQVELRFGK